MNNLDVLKRMAEKSPNDGNVLYLLAKEYLARNMMTEALQTLTKALPYADENLSPAILNEISSISASLISKGKMKSNGTKVIRAKKTDTYPDEYIDKDLESTDSEDDYDEDDEDENDYEEDDEDDDDNDDNDEDEGTICSTIEVSGGSTRSLQLIGGNREKNSSHRKIEIKQQVNFSDVGGLSELKNIITMKIIKPFMAPELFAKFMKKTGGGLLLYGPPGCGKTFISKATAGECNASFRSVKISDVLDPYIGQSEQNIANIFSVARTKKPCILFFDEIDTLGYNRSKSSSDTIRSVVDTLLVEIEGIDTNTDKLLIIGATNMPWDIDPALRRPGRFDRSVFVHPPDEEARKCIFTLKMKDRPCGKLNYEHLAKMTALFSGADIEHVVEQAAEKVLNKIFETGNENLKITQDTLVEVIETAKPSTIEWLRTISSYVRYANQTGFYDEVDKFLMQYKHMF